MKSKKIITLFFVALFCFSFFVPFAFSGESEDKLDNLLNKDYLTSAEVIENADILDGYLITIRGEVIGEALERKDYCWINVYDNENFISIGVLTDLEMISDIEFWGGHRVTGNTVKIKGKVFRADPFADGELDIHAESISVLEDIFAGYKPNTIPPWKMITAIVLVLIMSFLMIENTYNFFKKRAESKDVHVLEQYIDD